MPERREYSDCSAKRPAGMTTMSAKTATHRGIITLALLQLKGVGPAAARRILRRTNNAVSPTDLSEYVVQSVQELLPRDRIGELQLGIDRAGEIVLQLAAIDAYLV